MRYFRLICHFFIIFSVNSQAYSQNILGGPWIIDSLIVINNSGDSVVPYLRNNPTNPVDLSLQELIFHSDGTTSGIDQFGDPMAEATWEVSNGNLTFDDKTVQLSQVNINEFKTTHNIELPTPNGTMPATVITKNVRLNPLPLLLISFSAKFTDSDDEIKLEWSTVHEIEHDYFEVQHSVNGADFKTIETLDGTNSDNGVKNYSFLHNQPFNGKNYYRLKMVDFSGSEEYSHIISVDIENTNIRITPNPAQNFIEIHHDNEYPLITEIIDAKGKKVIRTENEKIDISDLATGFYFILVRRPNGMYQVEKIIKE